MRVALFGATGGTGRSLIRQALAGGHEVTALARDPGALSEFGGDIEVVEGDVHDLDSVKRTVNGADVVASALGIGMHRHATTVYSRGTANIQNAMQAEGLRRLMVVSTSSLELPSRARFAEWALARFLLHKILSKPYADMKLMERTVRTSELDWTLVRAARLTNGPLTGTYRMAYDAKLAGCWSISRADVAHYLMTHFQTTDSYRRIAEIAY
jgi:putative NADH-flavin reductase